MFAVIYFYDDKSVDIVNKNKIKSTSSDFHVGTDVKVQYETEDIDESGRDIRRFQDYEGLVLCNEKDRAGAQAFLSDNQDQILEKGKQGKDGLVAWTNEQATEKQCQGRKRKKTAKILEMESALLEDQEERQLSSMKKKTIESKPKKTHKKAEITARKTLEKGKTAETQKIQTIEYFKNKKAVAQKMGTVTTAVIPEKVQCPTSIQESTQSQSPKYMPRNKSPISLSSCEKTSSPSQILQRSTSRKFSKSPTSSQESSQSQSLKNTTPRRKSPISLSSCQKPTTSTQIKQRRTSPRNFTRSPSSLQYCPTQKSSSTRKSLENVFSSHPSQLNRLPSNNSRSVEMPDASMDIAQVVSQGFNTLYGCTNIMCEEKIKCLEEENERLKKELKLKSSTTLKSEDQTSLLIYQLKTLIDRWEREHQVVDQYPNITFANNSSYQISTSIANQDYSVLQTSQHSVSPMPMQAYQQSTPSSVSSSQHLLPLMQASLLLLPSQQSTQCSLPSIHSRSTSHPMPMSNSFSPVNTTNISTSVAERRDMDECDFSHFFQQGEGKIKLIEGHSLFINATKFARIRKKSKKSDSRTLKALLDYYFTPAFLAQHSATGEKSDKPPLPREILTPIKDFIFQQFKTDPANLNSMVNRKCLDSKRKISKSILLQTGM